MSWLKLEIYLGGSPVFLAEKLSGVIHSGK